jgi:hypothetical protein
MSKLTDNEIQVLTEAMTEVMTAVAKATPALAAYLTRKPDGDWGVPDPFRLPDEFLVAMMGSVARTLQNVGPHIITAMEKLKSRANEQPMSEAETKLYVRSFLNTIRDTPDFKK